MLHASKCFIFPTDKPLLYPWVKASVCLLLAFSFIFVSYSVLFSSGDFTRRCPDCHRNPADPPPPADGPAPSPTPTDISHIVFGIGGSAQTWRQRRGYSELWWRPGETRGYVWLDEEPSWAWPATCPPYRVSENASRFAPRDSAARIARITEESVRLGMRGARWLVLGDDDTVFFVENLVGVLGKYDHEEMYYIGAPSESVEQDVMHSYGMAFGGGGFALSYPAAAALAANLDGCLARYAGFYGSDQRVQACLAELGVPLTREPGFHQVDLRGDTYGLLAAHPVAPLVSLHHLDYVKPISPRAATQLDALRSLVSASRFDEARILQQSFCYEGQLNWSVSVSWGYSVQLYAWPVPAHELAVPLQTFQTWRSFQDGPFIFNTRPFPPDRPCERPVLFFLDRAKEEGRTIVTEYARYDGKDQRCNRRTSPKVQRITVFAPKLEQEHWKNRAPRRQCCETRRSWWGKSMEVRIRSCRAGEITSPP